MNPYCRIWTSLSADVNEDGGRTVFVQPREQIVCRIVAGVTSGLSAPGVSAGRAA